MRPLAKLGLPERLVAILLLVTALEFFATSVLFERATTFSVQEEDAARLAQSLRIVRRTMEVVPVKERELLDDRLSTQDLELQWTPAARPFVAPVGAVRLTTFRSQVLKAAPELSASDLAIHLTPFTRGSNVAGAIRLKDGTSVAFKAHLRDAWFLTAGKILAVTLPFLLLMLCAWALFTAMLRPLKGLVLATRRVGRDELVQLEERGPAEVRQLIRAFNMMQRRIRNLLVARTSGLLAVGHDLRTPLARLQLRLDAAEMDEESRAGMLRDVAEMQQMFDSLQAFVETGGSNLPVERIDVAIMAATLVDTASDHGGDATYRGPEHLEIMARPVSLRRALANLLDNALHYAGRALVTVEESGDAVEIAVEDDGPGIPADRLEDVLQPFVRLDNARARDTPGMGLGIPIARRAARIEGGALILSNLPSGGFRAAIRLPRTAG